MRIVHVSGPQGLRLIKGFHDEALRGWRGHRSSRPGDQFRVIYCVEADEVPILVIDMTAHDYRRKQPLSRKDFRRSRKVIDVSGGESVRIVRELQELSQSELSELAGIPQSTISAIENDRINLGVERAKTLTRALECHPSVLVFPSWDLEKESAA